MEVLFLNKLSTNGYLLLIRFLIMIETFKYCLCYLKLYYILLYRIDLIRSRALGRAHNVARRWRRIKQIKVKQSRVEKFRVICLNAYCKAVSWHFQAQLQNSRFIKSNIKLDINSITGEHILLFDTSATMKTEHLNCVLSFESDLDEEMDEILHF